MGARVGDCEAASAGALKEVGGRFNAPQLQGSVRPQNAALVVLKRLALARHGGQGAQDLLVAAGSPRAQARGPGGIGPGVLVAFLANSWRRRQRKLLRLRPAHSGQGAPPQARRH